VVSLVILFLLLPLFLPVTGSFVLWIGPYLHLALNWDLWRYIFYGLLVFNTVSVLVWSYYYMDSCLEYRYFLSCLLTFIFSIIIILVAGNLILFFIGWDLLGFSSLWLVVQYRSRVSLLGGLLTGLSNRLGDCFFFLALSSSLVFSGTSSSLLLLFIFTSMTKSALLPFSAWLPLAMCAPTPVSALVHSSTLVTAGLLLLLRINLSHSTALSFLGLLTLLVGSFGSLVSMDLKKIVALSTLSHLGLMFAFLGLGSTNICFLHLICHGFVKACIFLCVGTIIHSSFGSQELRSCSGLASSHPIVLLSLLIASGSLSGLFFITCFASKHFFLLSLHNTNTPFFICFLIYVGLVLSVAYSWRLFFSLYQSSHSNTLCRSGYTGVSLLPCIFLALLSIIAGPLLANILVLDFRCISLLDGLASCFILGSGLFVGSLYCELGPTSFSPPFSILTYLSYSLLRSLPACSLIKNTELTPISPLF